MQLSSVITTVMLALAAAGPTLAAPRAAPAAAPAITRAIPRQQAGLDKRQDNENCLCMAQPPTYCVNDYDSSAGQVCYGDDGGPHCYYGCGGDCS